MYRLPLLALLLLAPARLLAQDAERSPQPPPSPHRIAHQALQGPGGPLAAVVALEQAEEQFTGRDRDTWLDALATQLIFVGDHRKALDFNSKAYGSAKRQPGDSDGSELEGYEPTPAVEAILKFVEGRRVVMLNEEHRSSRERAFAHELLEPLKQAGFTHLALETVGDPAGMNERKYPLAGDGYYTQDPILGDLVRRAAEMGMGIVEYEADMKQMPEEVDRASPIASTNWREGQQARNLKKFLDEHPEARLVVWSGRHHMAEDEADGNAAGETWTPMGGIFRQITGIDPLTVDLMVMNEQTVPEAEHKVYRWAVEQGLVKQPVVFMNEAGEAWSPIDSLDAAVFFPRTNWTNGRPDWLRMGSLRLAANVDWTRLTEEKPSPQRPLVVEARVAGESEEAVPMDRVIWREGAAPPLFIRPGREYILELRDPEGKVLASAQVRMQQ